MIKIKLIPIPNACQIREKITEPYFSDSYEFIIRNNLNAKQVYHAIFGFLPKPVQMALKLRNAVVGIFGFSKGNSQMTLSINEMQVGKQAGFLKFEKVTDEEVVTASYEPNMDMWLSVMKLNENTVAMSTLVNMKTRRGRWYMAVIKPFHRIIAKHSIASAIKQGRL